MYIREVEIENIRSIQQFRLKLDCSEAAGWHVLIGDNGAGKSTVVRAVALAIVGPNEAPALRQNWADWLRRDEMLGRIHLRIDYDAELDKWLDPGKAFLFSPLMVKFVLNDVTERRSKSRLVTLSVAGPARYPPKDSVWGTGSGWFAASFGPFRRFSGGDREESEKVYSSYPRVGAHLTAFGEGFALTEVIPWLKQLQFKALENGNGKEKQYLAALTKFINEGDLLQHGAVLEKITSDEVLFRDGNGCQVSLEQLSDGYRSILSLTFELIRQLSRVYGPEKVIANIQKGDMKIDLPGVVLIDEIDAHLHPTWQRRVGQWFCQYFPKMQFIVTTHSPLICQGAERGSVWRLAAPGSDAFAGRVAGTDLNRLVYGSVEDAYSTDLFGPDVTRSASSQKKLERLAQLNLDSLHRKLTKGEAKELQQLRATLPTMAGTLAADNGNNS